MVIFRYQMCVYWSISQLRKILRLFIIRKDCDIWLLKLRSEIQTFWYRGTIVQQSQAFLLLNIFRAFIFHITEYYYKRSLWVCTNYQDVFNWKFMKIFYKAIGNIVCREMRSIFYSQLIEDWLFNRKFRFESIQLMV